MMIIAYNTMIAINSESSWQQNEKQIGAWGGKGGGGGGVLLTCNDASELLHQGNCLLLLPIGVPLVIP